MKTIGTLSLDGGKLVLTFNDPIPGLPGRFESVDLLGSPYGRKVCNGLENIARRIAAKLNNELLETPGSVGEVETAVTRGTLCADDPEALTDPIIGATFQCLGMTVMVAKEAIESDYFEKALAKLRESLDRANREGLTPECRQLIADEMIRRTQQRVELYLEATR